ncbi:TPA: dihydroorotase [Pseudomonas putida]|nr:dihydroorotase [Pseudomonas putida]EKT4542293.1 dihydroorotase [Pseudomonas putida]EKT4568692.1 dihydroorotase [Pseudomonas putida]HDS1059409.1 dihydroorotase [Pseudomonas putida]HEJ1057735.1 dihydroorotase [Pseudomonas putida]
MRNLCGSGHAREHRRSRCPPFIGSRLPGAVRYTLVDGHLCHEA